MAILGQRVKNQAEAMRQTELSNLIPNYNQKRHESNNALKIREWCDTAGGINELLITWIAN